MQEVEVEELPEAIAGEVQPPDAGPPHAGAGQAVGQRTHGLDLQPAGQQAHRRPSAERNGPMEGLEQGCGQVAAVGGAREQLRGGGFERG